MPSNDVVIQKEGERLIIEPFKKDLYWNYWQLCQILMKAYFHLMIFNFSCDLSLSGGYKYCLGFGDFGSLGFLRA